jgi:hypothetical protein
MYHPCIYLESDKTRRTLFLWVLARSYYVSWHRRFERIFCFHLHGWSCWGPTLLRRNYSRQWPTCNLITKYRNSRFTRRYTLQLSRHFCVFNSPQDKNFPKKSSSHLEVLGTRRVTRSKFRTDDLLILGATVQNLLATANWCPRSVHPWTANVPC